MGSTSEDHYTESIIEIDIVANAIMGITLSIEQPLKIAKLASNSCFLGKLMLGDVIIAVNDTKLSNNAEFFNIATNYLGKMSIKIKRDEFCSSKMTSIPSSMPGKVESFEVEMNWRLGGTSIGIMIIQDNKKRVLVSATEPGSLAHQHLKRGDLITKINEVPILERSVAKKAILDSMHTTNKVKLTVYRRIMIKPLPDFDIPLPPDVLAIIDANRMSHREPCTLQPILKSSLNTTITSDNNNDHINMPEGPSPECEIEFDDFSKPTQPTPRRTGSY